MDIETLRLRGAARHLLSPWRENVSPGCTLGVVRDGALVLHESAGLACVELAHPIGPETTFRIASVSKQFTCTAILLLQQEGKLSIDEPVQSYLPDLPDFGLPVTLAHLMHNVSGVRDFLELLRLGGLDLPQPITGDVPLAAISRQRSLNFAPGTRYLYSNSNFLLLGRVVEAVSGEALRAFLDRRVFVPLGMSRTRHTPSPAEAVAGLATGYFPREGGGFARALHGYPLGGEGGLVSCVEDLAIWDGNFSNPRVGGKALIAELLRETPFLNGTRNAYARGLQRQDHRGLATVEHGGLWPGYKTAFLRVPDRGATIICIANLATIDPHAIARRMLDAVIDGTPGVHAIPPLPPVDTLDRLAGRYLDREGGVTVDLSVNEAGLPVASVNGVPAVMQATEDGRLAASGSSVFTLRPAGDGIAVEKDAGVTATYGRIAAGATLPAGIAGRYVNDELGAEWTITATAQGAALAVAGPWRRADAWEILPIEGDIIRIMVPGTLFRGWLDVRVLRDAAGAVSALHVNGGRARDITFTRLSA